MQTKVKTCTVSGLKVLDAEQGVAEMIVSVFNNVDAAKEMVCPGFFKDSLKAKLPKGVWAHDWTCPVAKTLEAEELLPGDSRLPEPLKELGGLYIKGQFNLDTQRGRDAFSDLKFGTIDEFSFGYDVQQEQKDAKTGVTRLIKGTMYEWSPVLVGCNPATALLSTKNRKFYAPGGYNYDPETGTYTYEQDTAASATVAALNAIYSDLCEDVADSLSVDGATGDEVADQLAPVFDEFTTQSIAVIRALLTILAGSGDGEKSAALAVLRKGAITAARTKSATAPGDTSNTNNTHDDNTNPRNPQPAADGKPSADTNADAARKAAINRTLANLATTAGMTILPVTLVH